MDADHPDPAVLAAADRQRPQIHPGRYRQGRDDGGQGVAADELQHQRARGGGADPAQHRAEAVRQVVGSGGEVSRGLARYQPDRHPVGEAGCRNLAKDGQHHPALVERGETAYGHHRGPAPAVVPGPPLATSRGANEAGERGREAPAPQRQHGGDAHGQDYQAKPADYPPHQRTDHDGQDSDRVAEQEPHQPDDHPHEVDDGHDR
jgi:hypothetical protein